MENPIPKEKIGKKVRYKYPLKEKIKLKKDLSERGKDFFKVIRKRSSSREFEGGISEKLLAELLWYTSKTINISTSDNGMVLKHRPSPSAGGLHPIDIIISLPTEDKRSFSLYNSIDHCLYSLDLNESLVKDFCQHIDEIVNIQDSLIIWFLAHPQRTKVKYENVDSLIWRDAGAYIYCFQIVATALDLNSCPIGSLGAPFISKLFGDNVFGAGGILIG